MSSLTTSDDACAGVLLNPSLSAGYVKKSGQAKPSPKPSPKAPAAKAPSNPAAEPPSNPYAKPRGPGDSSKRRRTDGGGAGPQPAI